MRHREGGIGEDGGQRLELLHMLGRLQNPPLSASQILQGSQNALEVLIVRRLVGLLVMLPPAGEDAHRVKEHRGARHSEQVDLFVHMVPSHLVHAIKVGEEVVALIYALLGSLHAAVYGLLAFGCHRLQSFPPRQRAQIFVRSYEVVQMRGA